MTDEHDLGIQFTVTATGTQSGYQEQTSFTDAEPIGRPRPVCQRSGSVAEHRRLQRDRERLGQRQPRREQGRLLRGRLDPVPDEVRQPDARRRTPSRSSGTRRRAASTRSTTSRPSTGRWPTRTRALGVSRVRLPSTDVPDPGRSAGDRRGRDAGRRQLHAVRRHDHGVSAYSYPDGAGFAGRQVGADHDHLHREPGEPGARVGRAHRDAGRTGAPNNSAVAISGSPYHTRLINLDGSGGNQDRSLSADAVIFPGSITIIKDADPERRARLPASRRRPGSAGDFSLVDDGTDREHQGVREHHQLHRPTRSPRHRCPRLGRSTRHQCCTVTSPNGGSDQPSVGTTATIDLKEGENVTCTFTEQAAERHADRLSSTSSTTTAVPRRPATSSHPREERRDRRHRAARKPGMSPVRPTPSRRARMW